MSQQVAGEAMATMMREHLADGAVVECVCHCAREGPLATARDEWTKYDSLAGLPDRELLGWEELVVFTSDHVYRQVGVGFGGEVRVTPRTPVALIDEAAAPGAVGAAADDD